MRVAVYLRQSLDRDGDGLAVERQRRDCLALCEQRGWEPVEYVDNSVSASSRKPRPAYQRMIEDIEAGLVRGVVVWDLDRLHRQPVELETFIPLAQRLGLALATVTGDADLSTDNGQLFARIKGAVARAEMDRKSARQKAAHRQRAAAGKPWTTRRPFGFAADGIEHNEREAGIIRQLYDDALAGASQSSMARDLNARGFRTTLGNEWTQNAVRGLLMNPRNAGLRSYRGEIAGPGVWDEIVPVETWRAVVERFTSNPPRKGGGSRKHLLAGLALCGVCGAKARTGYTNRGVRLYVCPARHVGRKAEDVDGLVSAVVVERLRRPDAHGLLLAPQSDDAAQIALDAVEAAREALSTLAEMFAAGEMPAAAYKAGNARARQRLAEAEAALPRHESAAVLEPLLNAPDPGEAWQGQTLARRRAVLDVLLRVHIDRTGRGSRFDPESVRITWKGGAA